PSEDWTFCGGLAFNPRKFRAEGPKCYSLGWRPRFIVTKKTPALKGRHIMPQSLANIVVHLVFSTKVRRPLLRDDEREQLHAYTTGVLRNHDSHLIEINSVRDHIHILF